VNSLPIWPGPPLPRTSVHDDGCPMSSECQGLTVSLLLTVTYRHRVTRHCLPGKYYWSLAACRSHNRLSPSATYSAQILKCRDIDRSAGGPGGQPGGGVAFLWRTGRTAGRGSGVSVADRADSRVGEWRFCGGSMTGRGGPCDVVSRGAGQRAWDTQRLGRVIAEVTGRSCRGPRSRRAAGPGRPRRCSRAGGPQKRSRGSGPSLGSGAAARPGRFAAGTRRDARPRC
jgi:hypothetical protein